ncbi:MAG: WcbI family polysaccharide biosynthesis putative acetyltransferase [Pseudomonadota bacterium]
MPSFGVIGSCQAYGVAESLKGWVPGATAYPLNAGSVAAMSEDDQQQLADKFTACDIVYIESVDRISKGPLTAAALSAKVRVLRYPVVVYTGLHPDCIHVYNGSQLIQTHMGPYNSALVLAAFNAGLSPARTEALFNRFAFASLGYIDQREAATAEMQRYFEGLGFTCMEFVDKIFMHTINHPYVEVLHDITKQALDISGFQRDQNDVPAPVDTLLEGASWPIYDGVGEYSSYVFRGHANKGEDRDIDLAEFIVRSFEVYKEMGTLLSPPAVERAAEFITSEVIM